MAFRSPPELSLRNALRIYRSGQRMSSTSAKNRFRAAVCTEIGKPLQVIEKERKVLQKDEVRVAVKRAAVNFSDLLTVQGKYQERPQLPFVPGTEFSGEILEVGSDVKSLKPGDNVVGLSFGLQSFAEEIVAGDKLLYRVGAHKTPENGAAVVSSYGTAELSLDRVAHIKESEFVLVTAAAGALGLAAVDLAANVFKANVIGACGGAEKCELVTRYGAKFAIDYTKENLKERVKEITKGRGVDIVFDVVGGQVLEDGIRCLAFEGRLLTLGYASGKIPKIPANILLVKNISVHGVYWGSYSMRNPKVNLQSISRVIRLWEEGKIKPHIGKVFPLAQVNEALECISSRQSTGKVLLDCTK